MLCSPFNLRVLFVFVLCVFEGDTPGNRACCLSASGIRTVMAPSGVETNPTGCWFDGDSPDQSRKIHLYDAIITH